MQQYQRKANRETNCCVQTVHRCNKTINTENIHSLHLLPWREWIASVTEVLKLVMVVAVLRHDCQNKVWAKFREFLSLLVEKCPSLSRWSMADGMTTVWERLCYMEGK